MSARPRSFLAYWLVFDRALLDRYAIDSFDAGVEPERIAEAQEQGWSPEELAEWYGDKYGLERRDKAD